MRCLLILSLSVIFAHAAIYNPNLAIKLKGSTPDDFFGYSVALQQGAPPRVIIGAPKHGSNKVGSVYVCPLTGSDSITDNSCRSYSISGEHIENAERVLFEDNMFGACIDGGIDKNDDILIGTPKLTEDGGELYYVVGGIFKLSEIEKGNFQRLPKKTSESVLTHNGEYYYGNAQFGFSIHAVNSSDSLYGTPGFSHWRGDAFRAYLTENKSPVPASRSAPRRVKRELIENTIQLMKLTDPDSSLAGYAVTSGQFFGHTSYVVGLPNGKSMMGDIKLYFNENGKTINERVSWPNYEYRQIAEHFGSTLAAADINGDGFEDLLVGAPNANEDSYDNGKVYVFISNKHNRFELHQTLVGEAKSRFGTSITNLGKITLDAYESIAIGAPYENGVGAVRVYVWYESKLTLDSVVSLNEFSSFGYSLSRAVDIDSNKVADIAVGAYLSDAVAVLKAKSVFYYNVTLEYNTLYSDQVDNNLHVNICIQLFGIQDTIQTEKVVEFDDRIKNVQFDNQTITVSNNGPSCKRYDLEISLNAPRLKPLNVIIRLQENTCDTCPVHSPTYSRVFREKIPFSNNCKHETCIPILTIEPNIVKSLVVGEQDKYELIVNVLNKGDSAFLCEVDVQSFLPVGITPVNSKQCTNTLCSFNYIMSNSGITQAYTLDFSGWSVYETKLDIEISTTCFNKSSTTSSATINLKYQSKLTVEAPQLNKQYDSKNISTYNIDSAAIFHVTNEGPSSLKSATFIISIPRISSEEQIIDIFETEDNSCLAIDALFDTKNEYQQPDKSDSDDSPTVAGFGSASDASNTISCDDPKVKCMQIQCKVRNLQKNQMVRFIIPIRLKMNEILKQYYTTFSIKSTITRPLTKEEFYSELDVIDRQTIIEGVAVWIIIVAILGALLLLALLIFGFYKAGFFYREQHERLMEEKEMEETMVPMRNTDGGGAPGMSSETEDEAKN